MRVSLIRRLELSARRAVDSKGGAPMTTNGIVFDNRYSCAFRAAVLLGLEPTTGAGSIEVSPQTGKIIEIRAYLDRCSSCLLF